MKKEDQVSNSSATASVVLGIMSIVLASLPGLLLGITAFVFAVKQEKYNKNKWTKAGKVLSIIGVILSIAAIVASIYILKNTDVLNQLTSQYGY